MVFSKQCPPPSGVIPFGMLLHVSTQRLGSRERELQSTALLPRSLVDGTLRLQSSAAPLWGYRCMGMHGIAYAQRSPKGKTSKHRVSGDMMQPAKQSRHSAFGKPGHPAGYDWLVAFRLRPFLNCSSLLVCGPLLPENKEPATNDGSAFRFDGTSFASASPDASSYFDRAINIVERFVGSL